MAPKAWASSSASLIDGDSIEVKRVFFESPPAIVKFFDPYAGTGTGMMNMMDTFGWGNYSPAINFMLMPISFDLQKIQAIELNDQVRKSQFARAGDSIPLAKPRSVLSPALMQLTSEISPLTSL